jgi:hypothetical protein
VSQFDGMISKLKFVLHSPKGATYPALRDQDSGLGHGNPTRFRPQALKGRANRCLHDFPNSIFISICGAERRDP